MFPPKRDKMKTFLFYFSNPIGLFQNFPKFSNVISFQTKQLEPKKSLKNDKFLQLKKPPELTALIINGEGLILQ